MAANHKGLGRGLDALFQNDADKAKTPAQAQYLSLEALKPNPRQPRRDFDQGSLDGLAESIRSQGMLQPILVRPLGYDHPGEYEIVAGERRWRAARLAGLHEVPVISRELSDQETLAAALVENLQREDLNPLEEALGLRRLKEDFGLSQEDLARALGKSRSAIANSLRLLHLSGAAQQALKEGKISAGHARTLLSLENSGERDSLLGRILAEKLNVREAEGLAALQKTARAKSSLSPEDEDRESEGRDSAAPEEEAEKPDSSLSASPARARLPQSAVLLELQSRMEASVCLPVKISGGEGRGKVSISYSSKEELARLLKKIGIQAEF
ncbi:MAG: ParB/RepB/Spo0J family partition protein [Deltaproteobacteria bacterium]|jgi:ParB family chromosome partitioning protein|nr:ParB/RepB/Spo0J family partition protein [Deltaproteobacteria bacterium]